MVRDDWYTLANWLFDNGKRLSMTLSANHMSKLSITVDHVQARPIAVDTLMQQWLSVFKQSINNSWPYYHQLLAYLLLQMWFIIGITDFYHHHWVIMTLRGFQLVEPSTGEDPWTREGIGPGGMHRRQWRTRILAITRISQWTRII